MNLAATAVAACECMLLSGGRRTRLGGSLGVITGIIIAISIIIRQSGRIARYEGKKQRMTKRINAVITNKERKRMDKSLYGTVVKNDDKYRYLYTFTGLEEYEGMIFYDKSLWLKKVHVKGEKVTLLINENDMEEFWFEEEEEPGKGAVIGSVVIIVLAVLCELVIIRNWDRLPWW